MLAELASYLESPRGPGPRDPDHGADDRAEEEEGWGGRRPDTEAETEGGLGACGVGADVCLPDAPETGGGEIDSWRPRGW